MKKWNALTAFTILICVSATVALSAQKVQRVKTVDNAEINVTSLVEMKYPLAAKVKRLEGIVVAWVQFDNDGHVVSAEAISGSKDFIEESLANVRKWRFHPTTPDKVAIIVYDFRIDGFCREGSHFSFRAPNVASVTGCYLAPPPISPD